MTVLATRLLTNDPNADMPPPDWPAEFPVIVLEVIVPKDFGDIRHSHGRPWVAGIRGLHRVHAESADSVREKSPGWLAGGAGLL